MRHPLASIELLVPSPRLSLRPEPTLPTRGVLWRRLSPMHWRTDCPLAAAQTLTHYAFKGGDNRTVIVAPRFEFILNRHFHRSESTRAESGSFRLSAPHDGSPAGGYPWANMRLATSIRADDLSPGVRLTVAADRLARLSWARADAREGKSQRSPDDLAYPLLPYRLPVAARAVAGAGSSLLRSAPSYPRQHPGSEPLSPGAASQLRSALVASRRTRHRYEPPLTTTWQHQPLHARVLAQSTARPWRFPVVASDGIGVRAQGESAPGRVPVLPLRQHGAGNPVGNNVPQSSAPPKPATMLLAVPPKGGSERGQTVRELFRSAPPLHYRADASARLVGTDRLNRPALEAAAALAPPDLEDLTREIWKRFDKRLRIERERHGRN